jgi:hypothetical protein
MVDVICPDCNEEMMNGTAILVDDTQIDIWICPKCGVAREPHMSIIKAERIAEMDANQFSHDWDGICNWCGVESDKLIQTGGNILLCHSCHTKSTIQALVFGLADESCYAKMAKPLL